MGTPDKYKYTRIDNTTRRIEWIKTAAVAGVVLCAWVLKSPLDRFMDGY